MVNGVKVTQNTGCSARTADKQRESAFLFYSQRNFVTNQNTGCEDGGNQIPEKLFSTEGKSPDRRTKKLINPNPRAASRINRMPFT